MLCTKIVHVTPQFCNLSQTWIFTTHSKQTSHFGMAQRRLCHFKSHLLFETELFPVPVSTRILRKPDTIAHFNSAHMTRGLIFLKVVQRERRMKKVGKVVQIRIIPGSNCDVLGGKANFYFFPRHQFSHFQSS